MSLTIFSRATHWSWKDKLLSFVEPRKALTVEATRLDQLMQQRFGLVFICQPCQWKYPDLVKRNGYRRNFEEFAIRSRCDGCRREYDRLHSFFPEDRFAALTTTREERHQRWVRRVAPFPEGFRDRLRRIA